MKSSLSNSKSVWGGIAAIAILFIRQILVSNGVIIPGAEWDLGILLVDAVAAAYGIYGFRDAIRKLEEGKNVHISPEYKDNLSNLEDNYLKDKNSRIG